MSRVQFPSDAPHGEGHRAATPVADLRPGGDPPPSLRASALFSLAFGMAHDVFLSYSTHDKHVADAMCASLEGAGIRCWIAPRDVTPGVEWADALLKAIRASRTLVVVFSASANASQPVAREVATAFESEIPVIPFRIDQSLPAGSIEFFIKQTHWLDAMTPPLEAHLDRLREVVSALLGSSEPSSPRRAPSVPAPAAAARALRGSGRRRGLWIAAAGLVFGGGALAATLWNPPPPRAPKSQGSGPPTIGGTDRDTPVGDSPEEAMASGTGVASGMDAAPGTGAPAGMETASGMGATPNRPPDLETSEDAATWWLDKALTSFLALTPDSNGYREEPAIVAWTYLRAGDPAGAERTLTRMSDPGARIESGRLLAERLVREGDPAAARAMLRLVLPAIASVSEGFARDRTVESLKTARAGAEDPANLDLSYLAGANWDEHKALLTWAVNTQVKLGSFEAATATSDRLLAEIEKDVTDRLGRNPKPRTRSELESARSTARTQHARTAQEITKAKAARDQRKAREAAGWTKEELRLVEVNDAAEVVLERAAAGNLPSAVGAARSITEQASNAPVWNAIAAAAIRKGDRDIEASMLAKAASGLDGATLALACAEVGRLDDAERWLQAPPPGNGRAGPVPSSRWPWAIRALAQGRAKAGDDAGYRRAVALLADGSWEGYAIVLDLHRSLGRAADLAAAQAQPPAGSWDPRGILAWAAFGDRRALLAKIKQERDDRMRGRAYALAAMGVAGVSPEVLGNEPLGSGVSIIHWSTR